MRALKHSSTKQTEMLETLLHQHLQNQLLLSGNPVIAPVLGHQIMFRWVCCMFGINVPGLLGQTLCMLLGAKMPSCSAH